MAYIPVMIALIAAAVLLGVGIFFKVSVIMVTGNDMYSETEILQAAGIKEGGNMFLISSASTGARIRRELECVDRVDVDKKYPDTVVISVTESIPMAFVRSAGGLWVIDKNAKLLKKTDDAGTAGLIAVIGAEPINPEKGASIALGQSGSVKLEYLKKFLNAVSSRGMEQLVSNLDMTNISDVVFVYQGRFTVHLGTADNAADKLALLERVAANYAENIGGKIDLSTDGEAHVIPE